MHHREQLSAVCMPEDKFEQILSLHSDPINLVCFAFYGIFVRHKLSPKA